MALPLLAKGKVREVYDLDDKHLLLVSSDRISAFDVIMDEPIPDRGRVLTGLTEFWLRHVAADLPNHFVSVEVPDAALAIEDIEGRAMVVRKAEMLPIELIVRAYLAGSGWKEYRTSRTLHGMPLPDGLKLGSKLPEPVLTPSTKGALGEHDVNLTWEQAADVVGADVLLEAERLAMEMFRRGSERARAHGLILADTKFELGYIDGTLSLCDEILTPDSSRYWPSTGWELGETPPAYDKQVLRDFLESLEWGKTTPAPPVPEEIRSLVRSKYVEIYERISGRSFADWPGVRP